MNPMNRKGQVAPLMIMFIAVALVCMMVVFNLGKVSLNKVHTQNAADAGALAASSWLASGSNMVGDIGQMMNVSSLFFVATMAGIEWPSPGLAYATVFSFCIQQEQATMQADTIDDLVHERAREAALIYAFINAGVDEQKRRPTAEDDYKAWKKEDTPFNKFLRNGKYKSGIRSWERWTEYERREGQNGEFVTFKKYRPASVKVDVGDISHISYSRGKMPGMTWWVIYTPTGPEYIPLPFIVWPANITVHGNRSASVNVTRQETGADWQLWQMEMPTISSSAEAATQGGSSISSGGNYDCNLTRVN